MSTALALEAELAGEERAIRHLVGERAALNSRIKREHAHEQLLKARIHAITTRHHPAVKKTGGPIPHGDRFPDVSSFQPNVEWGAVHGAHSVRVGQLAFTKLTEGGGWTDPFGGARMRAMAALGFAHRGGYHFYHPSVSPLEQSNHLLETLHRGAINLTPADVLVCDLEVSDGERPQIVRAGARDFAAELRKHIPAKLWLYSGGPFVREFGVTLAGYDGHWLAAYVNDPAPFMAFGRARTIAWQYTDGHFGPVPHVCPGIGACDLSIIL